MICFTDRSKASESIHVKMLHCWKSHVAAHTFLFCLSFDMLPCVFLVLIDFLLTVKAATLIFISGRGSAISSSKQGKSGSFYNFVKK